MQNKEQNKYRMQSEFRVIQILEREQVMEWKVRKRSRKCGSKGLESTEVRVWKVQTKGVENVEGCGKYRSKGVERSEVKK